MAADDGRASRHPSRRPPSLRFAGLLRACESFDFGDFGMSQIKDLQGPKSQKSNRFTSSQDEVQEYEPIGFAESIH
jgi:hypothetical protein